MHIHKFQIYSNLDFQTAVAKWQDVSLKLSWKKQVLVLGIAK